MSESSATLMPRKPAGPRPGPPAPRRFGSTAKPSTATHGYSSSAVPPEKKPRQVTFSNCECEVQEYVPEPFEEPLEEEPEESGGLAALVQRRRRLLEAASKQPDQDDAAVYYLAKDKRSTIRFDSLPQTDCLGSAVEAELGCFP
ncbi:unnamed protein product [Symbiodinium sp. CCMP2592]|nr:unnamed protein product [Symbiodinium sp. CCMP2592]